MTQRFINLCNSILTADASRLPPPEPQALKLQHVDNRPLVGCVALIVGAASALWLVLIVWIIWAWAVGE